MHARTDREVRMKKGCVVEAKIYKSSPTFYECDRMKEGKKKSKNKNTYFVNEANIRSKFSKKSRFFILRWVFD